MLKGQTKTNTDDAHCNVILQCEYAQTWDRRGYCEKYGVDLISLIAPTSAQRIAMIAKEAQGFLYVVSSLGVTGTRNEITTDLDAITKIVRENTKVPCAIGFGISTPEQAQKIAGSADGIIVGSAIVSIIAEHGRDAAGYVGAYVKKMKDALR